MEGYGRLRCAAAIRSDGSIDLSVLIFSVDGARATSSSLLRTRSSIHRRLPADEYEPGPLGPLYELGC
jgi:hypothetical protein